MGNICVYTSNVILLWLPSWLCRRNMAQHQGQEVADVNYVQVFQFTVKFT